ncbi:MAG: BON domain-containing protein [Acidobacteria bacterium]|nr:BON domain-containing protein [Acidobacteriota bacterium]
MSDRYSSIPALVLLSLGTLLGADKETTTFQSYVDSDLCSHLYAGGLTQTRISCSKETYKQGSNPVLVRLKDNWVFDVNKEKMIKHLVGGLATASGQVNYGDSTMKLKTIEPTTEGAIPAGEKLHTMLDVRHTKANPGTYEKIRHTLAMMPYVSYFDFISFTLNGSEVILTGWTTRQTNRYEAYNRVKQIEGVETVINNLSVTPLGTMDNQIRAAALAVLQRNLSRYFWGGGSAIKIVVKNGDIILLGMVSSKADSDIANIRCNGIASAFHVFNLLQVTPEPAKKEKSK